MPTYEYVCTECGHHTEAVQSFHDSPLTICPECGGALRKVFGAVGIVLKGSGFYKTDSRSTPRGTDAPKEPASSSSSGESSSSDGASATTKSTGTESSSSAAASTKP
jgi:putative FmdB family regulatory protein